MHSVRTISRVIRTPIARSFARSISTTPQRAHLASRWRNSLLTRQPRLAAPFSTTFRAFEKQGAVDEQLALKIESELKLESGLKEHEEASDAVMEFLEHTPFKLNDKPGQHEVELVRRFGDETIRVAFSISDLNSLAEDNPEFFDEAGEDDVRDSGSLQSGGARVNQSKVANTNHSNEEEDEEAYDDEEDLSFPARVNVVIEKPNQGALQIESIAQDGMIVIENVFYLKNAALASAQTSEADWERRGIYAGPPFGNLDEDLQVLFERYLDERGINTSLALFIPDYIDFKEQKEYLNWLENIKGFISA